MVLWSDRKKNSGKGSCLKRIRGYNTGEEGGGSRHSFAKNNDKNNVIADKNFFLLFLVNNNYYFLIPKCRFTKDISLDLF